MKSSHNDPGRQAELALVASIWEAIGARLDAERHRVAEEIANYPPPIPACDAQFNYLLEQRESIRGELSRLHEASRNSQGNLNPIAVVEQFIQSSRHLDDATRKRAEQLVCSARRMIGITIPHA